MTALVLFARRFVIPECL